MRFLVENYPYEVILPTFPEVSACFEFLDFVTTITFVTDVTAKHGRPPTVTTQILECNNPNTHRVCSICFFECYASARARGPGGASRGTRTCRGGEI